MGDYAKYYLIDNPFPETAVIDPTSDDIRMNGGIFCEDIFKKEIENLKKKTDQGVNVIYLSGIKFERGIGKSALMINHMRSLRQKPTSTCAYVPCKKEDKPRDVARKVVEQWHISDYLWNSFKTAFLEFSRARNDPLLTPDAVAQLFKDFPSLPEKLPLSRYTHMRDVEKLANAFSSWVTMRVKAGSPSLNVLAENYLVTPTEFSEAIKRKTVDSIGLYDACSKFLNYFGYSRHYVFLDQFEDMVMGTSKAGIGKFALDMKSMIRASSGSSSVFVTLHPDSETRLRMQVAQDMTGVAPLDTVHRIDVMILDTRGDSAIHLAEKYFQHFRFNDPPYPTYPIKPELLEFMCYLERGLIRRFLQLLHNALAYGATNGWPELTFEFARKHSLDVLGKDVEQDIKDFNKHRGRVV